MAMTDKQKKLNRLNKKLAQERLYRDGLFARRIGAYHEWNNFDVALRLPDGSVFGLWGCFDGDTARYTKNFYKAQHAENVRLLMAEIRELKKAN